MAIRDIYSRDDLRGDAPMRRSWRGDAAGSLAPDRWPGLLGILWRRKLIIATSMLLCLGAGAAYIALVKPTYLASTAFLIDPRLGKSVGSDPNVPGFIADTAAMDSQIKLFTSQGVLARVAKMANLSQSPQFDGSQEGILQRLLHPGRKLVDGVDLKALDDAITIKRPERTYVIEVDVLAQDPDKAAEIANAIPKAYVADQIQSRVGATKDETGYVRQKLDALSSEIGDADTKIEAYKSRNAIVDSTGLRSNEQQVADLTKALAEAQARTSDAKSRYAAMSQLARRGRLDATTDALKSPTIERLRQQQGETEQNVARLRQTLGPRHPEMIEAMARESKLQALLREELQRQKLASASDYQAAKRNEAEILADVGTLKGQSTAMSRALVPLDQLERNRRVLQSSFDRFAQINDNLAPQAGDTPPGRVLAIAAPPVSPARPKKTVVAFISLGAGLFFGLAAALFAEGTALERPPAPSVVFEPETRAPSGPRPVEREIPRGRPRRYWDDDDVGT